MKVILLQNIKGFGQIGDVKNVSDGYAWNFLFPRNMAKMATDDSVKEAIILQKKRETSGAIENEAAQKAAAALENASIEFTKKASKTGKLFSSVTKEMIAKEVSKLAGMTIKPDMIDLGDHGEHIKQIGDHLIGINLSSQLKIEIKIKITAP